MEITSVSFEKRIFNPSKEFSSNSYIQNIKQYKQLHKDALENPGKFWGNIAGELSWDKKWDTVLDWQPPFAKWFDGGLINASYNCIDRHLIEKAEKPAIIWEGEPGDQQVLTYKTLHKKVGSLATFLSRLGLKKGDRVAIYLPMIPELIISMLACTRLGIEHCVVFAGFSSDALQARINDAEAKLLITADGGYRKGKKVPLKQNADKALINTPTIQNVLVCKRLNEPINFNDEIDIWWDGNIDLLEPADDVPVESEHPLFILYTSGTTGKPKGVVHATGGYLVQAYITTKWIFDLKDNDIFWCTADCGWITGHTYLVYGPLLNGATVFMYEGVPNYPEPDRFWDIIERHKISILYTAPTAIRSFMQWGNDWVRKHDLSSLRLLGSVGEPINPEAWIWYYKNIGNKKCPIVDTWWQTETGSILISPIPGAIPGKPGSATLPFPGIDADVVDLNGNSLPPNKGGYLVIKNPWPSMIRTVFKDPKRYIDTYWKEINGMYFTGDGAKIDEDGYIWVLGRIDDTLNVSGHRLATAEIESALVSHPAISEAAVIGKPHKIKGQSIFAFITLRQNKEADILIHDNYKDILQKHVVTQISPIARPDEIKIVDSLPKTRSGKIIRRILRDIASEKEITGDLSTVEDEKVLESLRVV